MVIDARGVNAALVKPDDTGADAPDTRDTVALHTDTLNSTVDMKHAFYQIRASAQAAEYSTLQAPPGSPAPFFQLQAMAMGVETAPMVFQRAAMRMFAEPVANGTASVYLDDTWVRSGVTSDGTAPKPLADVGTAERAAQLADHEGVVHALLQAVIKAEGFFDLHKGQYFTESFRLLGNVRGPAGRQLPHTRIQALRDMGVPRTVPQLRSWLGTVIAMREYELTPVEPMRVILDLLQATQGKGGVADRWRAKEQEAYDPIMERLDHNIQLQALDRGTEVEIEVDASASGWGAVYKQRRGDGYVLLALHAHQWTEAQRALTNTQREYAALLAAVQHINPLMGTTRLVVWTDHQHTLAFVKDMEAAEHPMLRRCANLLAFYPVLIPQPAGQGARHGGQPVPLAVERTSAADASHRGDGHLQVHHPGAGRRRDRNDAADGGVAGGAARAADGLLGWGRGDGRGDSAAG
jgi:hypothetical protein